MDKQNIAHCDIKPDNILISADHKAFICDLSVYKLLDDPKNKDLVKTLTSAVGTKIWAAPEMRKALEPANIFMVEVQKLNRRVLDTFSLGLITFFCLEREAYEIHKELLNSKEEILIDLTKKIKAKVPEFFFYILLSMVSFNPQRRPSPSQLYKDLKKINSSTLRTTRKDCSTQIDQSFTVTDLPVKKIEPIYITKDEKIEVTLLTNSEIKIKPFKKIEISQDDLKRLLNFEKFKKFMNTNAKSTPTKLDLELPERLFLK